MAWEKDEVSMETNPSPANATSIRLPSSMSSSSSSTDEAPLEDPVIAGIRAKNRESILDHRKKSYSQLLNAKRKFCSQSESHLQFGKITRAQVTETSRKLKKAKTVDLLQFLNAAFLEKTDHVAEFLKVDGALYSLVGCLSGNNLQLQLEAAVCLINLMTGSHKTTKTVLKVSAAYLITYLANGSANLQSLCAWAIGNAAADCNQCCELLKLQGAIPALISLLQVSHPDVVHSATFALATFTSNAEVKDCNELMTLEVLSNFGRLFQQSAIERETAVQLALIFYHLSAHEDFDSCLLNAGIIDVLADVLKQLVTGESEDLKLPTLILRSIGNLCAGNEAIVHALLKCPQIGAIFQSLLGSRHAHLLKESLWALSNITGCRAGLLILDLCPLLPLIEVRIDDVPNMSIEALRCLYNIACLSVQWRSCLMTQPTIAKLLSLLQRPDANNVQDALAVLVIFARDHTSNVGHFLAATDCRQLLQGLQKHPLPTIQHLISELTAALPSSKLQTAPETTEKFPDIGDSKPFSMDVVNM